MHIIVFCYTSKMLEGERHLWQCWADESETRLETLYIKIWLLGGTAQTRKRARVAAG